MRVYVDNAATTAMSDEVFEAMVPYMKSDFGNPSTIYAEGRRAKSAIESAREQVAKAIGANKNEIFFTSSGTEANNWALKGCASASEQKNRHIITTAVEHHAVLHTCHDLENQGCSVTYLSVDRHGLVSLDDVEKAIAPDTVLLSVMLANNEVGTVMPISEIGKIAKKHGVVFHTDAVQGIGSLEIDVNKLNVDMLAFSAHKFHGPKGVGGLYIRQGTKINHYMAGGPQEKNYRAGTENVPGIVGLGVAIELATKDLAQHYAKLTELRDSMVQKVFDKIPRTRLNGHPIKRLPGNINFSFDFIEGESMLLMLDTRGISASSGSACTSGSLEPSHVLRAMGLPHETAHGSLRITFGKNNTMEHVDYIVNELVDIVKKLRAMSPLS